MTATTKPTVPGHALRVKAPQPNMGAKKQCSTCAKIRAASVAIASRIRDVIRGK